MSSRDLRDVTWPRSAATECLPLTPNYVCAGGVWSGWALWWCAHKVHTVQTVLCTPSPTPSLTPQLPTSPPALPCTLLLLLSQGQLLVWSSRSFGDASALSGISSLTATMVHSSSICRFLLLVLLGLLVAFVHTGKHPFECDWYAYFIFCGSRMQPHLCVVQLIMVEMWRETEKACETWVWFIEEIWPSPLKWKVRCEENRPLTNEATTNCIKKILNKVTNLFLWKILKDFGHFKSLLIVFLHRDHFRIGRFMFFYILIVVCLSAVCDSWADVWCSVGIKSKVCVYTCHFCPHTHIHRPGCLQPDVNDAVVETESCESCSLTNRVIQLLSWCLMFIRNWIPATPV